MKRLLLFFSVLTLKLSYAHRDFKVIAHRGMSSDFFFENSILAIKESQKLKVDFLELDFQFSKNNKLFLYHDYSLFKKESELIFSQTSSKKLKNMNIATFKELKNILTTPLLINPKFIDKNQYSLFFKIIESLPKEIILMYWGDSKLYKSKFSHLEMIPNGKQSKRCTSDLNKMPYIFLFSILPSSCMIHKHFAFFESHFDYLNSIRNFIFEEKGIKPWLLAKKNKVRKENIIAMNYYGIITSHFPL